MFTDENLGRFTTALKRRATGSPLFRKTAPRLIGTAKKAWTKRLHVGVRPPTMKLSQGFRVRGGRLTKIVNTGSGLALAEYEFDGQLGKFKIKKVFKKVVKAAGKIAAAPTAAGLQAVGLKKISGKLGKAVGYTKGEMNAIRSAGKGIQYAGAAVGAVVAAPYIGAAMGAVGKGALVAGKAVGGKLLAGGKLLKKGAGLFGGLLKKAPKNMEEAQAMAQDVQGMIPQTGGDGAAVPTSSDGSPAPVSPFAPSAQAYQDGGGTPSVDTAASPVTEAGVGGFPGNIPPVMLLAAGAAIVFSLTKKRGRA